MSVFKRFTEDNIIQTERVTVESLFPTTATLISGSFGAESSSRSTPFFIQLTGSSGGESYDIATVCRGAAYGDNVSIESRIIYKQFTNFFVGRQGDEEAHFQFSPVYNASSSQQYGFIAICLNRERFKDQLVPGTWEIKLGPNGTSGSFVDSSATSSTPVVRYGIRGRWDYIYSGTRKIGNQLGSISSSTPFGLVFYDYGTIIFNSAKDLQNWTGSYSTIGGVNPNGAEFFATKLLYSITGYGSTKLRSIIYTCVLNARDFNFSQNPTFYNPATGEILNPELRSNPRTYITTIGLYNDFGELLAIGKVDSPVEKSFVQNLIFNLRFDF